MNRENLHNQLPMLQALGMKGMYMFMHISMPLSKLLRVKWKRVVGGQTSNAKKLDAYIILGFEIPRLATTYPLQSIQLAVPFSFYSSLLFIRPFLQSFTPLVSFVLI